MFFVHTIFRRLTKLSFVGFIALTGVASHGASRTVIPNSTVSLEIPDGFTPLSASEIATKYKGANAPKFVMGNAKRGTSIAYELKPVPVKDSELEKGLAVMVSGVDKQLPGATWIRKEIIEQAGKRWIILEMKSKASNADIHNIIMITPFENQMLVFNFNSTTDEFPKFEKALRSSLGSIKLK
jgi:hypothetical protein